MQIIPDIQFQSGFSLISQKDHANGDKITKLGTHSFYGNTVTAPRWQLDQWDSGPCLIENRVDAGDSEITDGRWRSLRYDTQQDIMSFHLDTSLYYGGKPAIQGDYWPHLLIEQSDFGYADLPENEKAFYRCDAQRMVLTMDIRLDRYSVTPIPEDWVQAAQFLLYFYVKGTETHDFCWFGVQLFDNRWKTNDHFIGYDGRKADASGAMIFSIGSKYLYKKENGNLWKYGKPNPSEKWFSIEIDITPYLKQMFLKGKEDGYFKVDSLDQLCINGMNLGWETIGTFDTEISVRNLRLTLSPRRIKTFHATPSPAAVSAAPIMETMAHQRRFPTKA